MNENTREEEKYYIIYDQQQQKNVVVTKCNNVKKPWFKDKEKAEEVKNAVAKKYPENEKEVQLREEYKEVTNECVKFIMDNLSEETCKKHGISQRRKLPRITFEEDLHEEMKELRDKYCKEYSPFNVEKERQRDLANGINKIDEHCKEHLLKEKQKQPTKTL